MSLNSILNSAVSGLNASQAGLNTVSNNIANVNSPDYARQRVTYNTAVAGSRVSGVVVGGPERVADQFIEAAVFQRAGAAGRTDVTAQYLDRLQSLLGAPGDGATLTGQIDAVIAAAIDMTAPGAGSSTAAAFVNTVGIALGSVQQIAGDAAILRSELEAQTQGTVDRANELLSQIHGSNVAVSGTGGMASGAADQRYGAIRELAGLMDIVVRQQANGAVTIETANGTVLLDNHARSISYPDMAVRFTDAKGQPAAATGETLHLTNIGGKLGGYTSIRDDVIPSFLDRLNSVGQGLAMELNAASNALSQVPAPNMLSGRASGVVSGDRLGFTGKATFAVTASDGRLVGSTTIDFDALGPAATIDDAIAAINAGLGGAATASFQNGALQFQATASTNGVVIAQDPATPSARGGVGFSQFFGMNDLVRSADGPLVPTGFTPADPHGFGAGQSATLQLRDADGRLLAEQTITGASGPTFGDVLGEINGGSLGAYGSMAMDARGQFVFTPKPGLSGLAVQVSADTTDRLDTGMSFAHLSGLAGRTPSIEALELHPGMAAQPDRLPLAQFQTSAGAGTLAPGSLALARNDTRGSGLFVSMLEKPVDLGRAGTATALQLASQFVDHTARETSHAQALQSDASARFTDAVNRRNSHSGVNIDEELANMIALQNSYSAAARVITAASEMYDVLLSMTN